MALQPGKRYNVGDRVCARYSGFGNGYNPGTIVRVHSTSNQYDVRFYAGKTVTLFASEITEQLISTKIDCFLSGQKKSTTILSDLHSSDTMTNRQYQNLISSHRQNQKYKAPNPEEPWNLRRFKEFERSNRSRCLRAFNANSEQTSKNIVDQIHCASNQKESNLRYIKSDTLKYVKPLQKTENINIEDQSQKKTDDLFTEYGSRCTISMDLDFDKLVLGNDKFNDEFNEELASILDVDPTMIRIESVKKGSVIVTVAIIVGVVAALSVGAVIAKCISDCAAPPRNPRPPPLIVQSRQGSFVVKRGDPVHVDYKNKRHEARVFGISGDIDRGDFVTVEYIGDTKPYWFQKKETLPMDSRRLHYVALSDGDTEEMSVRSSCPELSSGLISENIADTNNNKAYHPSLAQSIMHNIEATPDITNEYSAEMKSEMNVDM